jgi:hypothetical protein
VNVEPAAGVAVSVASRSPAEVSKVGLLINSTSAQAPGQNRCAPNSECLSRKPLTVPDPVPASVTFTTCLVHVSSWGRNARTESNAFVTVTATQ